MLFIQLQFYTDFSFMVPSSILSAVMSVSVDLQIVYKSKL